MTRRSAFFDLQNIKGAMNILYYHGLNARLSQEKRDILERFGNVHAPEFNYSRLEGTEVYEELFAANLLRDVDVVVGSNLGGLLAHVVHELKDVPCLLLNPQLYKNSMGWNFESPAFYNIPASKKMVHIVLGARNIMHSFKENLEYIFTRVDKSKKIMVESEMAQSIPVGIFEKHADLFFKTLPTLILPTVKGIQIV